MHWISALLALAFLLSASAPSIDDKRITIYSTAANYSLSVVGREGHDYVGLLEILEPLGSVSARVDGGRWKLRYESVEGEFIPGKAQARIRGKELDLSGNFLLESGRGLVPLAALTTLLPRFLGGPVTFHDTARRMFIGSIATQFTSELSKTTPPKLVFNFSSPVNPTISTEPGKLHMVFSREPLLTSGTQTINFSDKTIPSATYQENNGAAEIAVAGTLPLMASFSNNGRTITITAAGAIPTQQPVVQTAQAPTAPQATQPQASPAPVAGAAPPTAPPVAATPVPVHRLLAVVDASHGGDERGAALTDQLPEKDVTLAIARKLRQELENRGITVVMLRDSDATMGLDQRAALANVATPAIYICVHASSQGNGVRLYTAALPSRIENHTPFLPWDAAQAASLAGSQAVASSVAVALRQKQVPARTLEAPLRPLNNIAAPAFAVELAPPGKDTLELASPAYEQLVAGAVANGVAQLRDLLDVKR